MAKPFSMKRIVLAAVLGAAAALAGMPTRARAMVGDVPSMPSVEQTTTTTSGSTVTSGGTTPGSGSPPSSTPEPPALLSGLLGIGLMAAYMGICRANS